MSLNVMTQRFIMEFLLLTIQLNKSLFMFVIQVLWSHSKVIITGGKNLNVREQKVGIIVINALIAQD